MSVSEKSLINRQVERVSAEQVHQAAEYQAAILADVAGRYTPWSYQTARASHGRCGPGSHRGGAPGR